MRQTAAAVAGLVLIVVLAAPASALFSSPAVSVDGNAFTAAVLQPPSNVAVTWVCKGKATSLSGTLSWTASPSSFAQGYRVRDASALVGTTSGTTMTVTGRKGDLLTFTVEAFAGGWSSVLASVTTTVC